VFPYCACHGCLWSGYVDIDVALGSRVNVKNAEMKAFKFADDGSVGGTTLVNNGGFTAFSV
jgi:hypothetical protein